MKRRGSATIVILLIVVAATLLLLYPRAFGVDWRIPQTGAETQNGNLSVDVSGKTELIGKDGKVVQTLGIYKLAEVFTAQGEAVSKLKATVNYKCSGEGLKWDTLTVSLYVSGMINDRLDKTDKEGTFVVELALTSSTLGYTPTSGQVCDFFIRTKILATVNDIAGVVLRAESKEVRHQVSTTYVSTQFTIDVTQSGTYETSSSSYEAAKKLAEQYAGRPLVVISYPA